MTELFPERQIIIIDADPNLTPTGRKKNGKINAAGYCRVSTDEQDQLNSFETQVKNYTNLINENPKWKMAGIFADEGISGKQMEKRDEFKKMLRLCRKGKIDLIMVKSVSRFARNTVECLECIRELKLLNVRVVFEKEGIDTESMNTELFLAIHSAFAQAESESISQNVRLGIRQNYRLGKFSFPYANLLGYKKGLDGRPKIIESEAKIIRYVYACFLSGDSYVTIANNITSKYANEKKASWSPQAIKRMLLNEKYMGDVLLQKTFTIDFIKGTQKINNGELPKYLIKHNHPPIVSEDIFMKVQTEIAKRKNLAPIIEKASVSKRGKHSGKYALSGKITCSCCGSKYRRNVWTIHGRKEVVWRCVTRVDLGAKYCKNSPTIKEEVLHKCILKACEEYYNTYNDISNSNTEEHILNATNQDSALAEQKEKLQAILSKIAVKNKDLDRLIDMMVNEETEVEFLNAKIKRVNDELSQLRLDKTQAESYIENASKESHSSNEGQLIIENFKSLNMSEIEYSDDLVLRLIESIKVYENKSLDIVFVDGKKIEVLNLNDMCYK